MSVIPAPKLKLSASDRFFCIGSCFVRNIELELIYRDISVLSKRIVCPKEEFGHRPTGMVTKYTTASMLNELKWAVTPPRPQDVLVETIGGWIDFQLHTVFPVSIERGIERRHYLMEDYFARLRQADVLIITLGYVETWLDTATGFYLNMAPSPIEVRKHPGRFQLERTDAATNLKHLIQIREALSDLSPECQIVITVSPVPMNATF